MFVSSKHHRNTAKLWYRMCSVYIFMQSGLYIDVMCFIYVSSSIYVSSEHNRNTKAVVQKPGISVFLFLSSSYALVPPRLNTKP